MEYAFGVIVIVGILRFMVELFSDGCNDDLYRYMDDEQPDDFIPRPIDYCAEKWQMIR